MAKFYLLKRHRHKWGDYYDILMHGMSWHLGRKDGLIQLERTGPFMPPVSLPGVGDIVVTDAFRRELEASGLVGLHFQPVVKKLIVRSDWHTWDKEADSPLEIPAPDGEPEDYVLGRHHSATTAKQIGQLWELTLNESALIHRAKRIGAEDDIYLLTDSWQGEDLFRAQGVLYNYATERAKVWLEEHAGEYVTFQEARTEADAHH